MKKHAWKDILPAVLLAIICIVLLSPFIYVSKYAYPWADDFGYGADTRLTFLRTGSMLQTIAQAVKVAASSYMSWQGTYTSCFLMSLQPAVWNTKLYHLTGSIMIISMLIAYIAFGIVIFRHLWKMPLTSAISISLTAFLVSAERVIGIAEAFTWYNSAVHYTFMNSLLILFVSMVALYVFGKDVTGSTPKITAKPLALAALCLLGVIVAGGNNITILTGMLILLTLIIATFVIEKKDIRLYRVKLMTPIFIFYSAGFLANVMAPGNKERGSVIGLSFGKANYVGTVINSIKVTALDITDKFSLELLAVLIIVAIISWRAFYLLDKNTLSFSFNYPLLIVLASYLLLSAMYCPALITSKYSTNLKDIYILATSRMIRTENIIYFDMVLLMIFDVVYCLGWIRMKGITIHSNIADILITVIAVIICIIGIRTELFSFPGQHYLTTTAIENLKDGTAAYYGYQMAENTNRLMSEDADVYVMPFGVSPNSLYPYDAADWKEGAKLFYDKNSVEYESEPYQFTR